MSWAAVAVLAGAWGAVAAYVLRRARNGAGVPFLHLWHGTATVVGRAGGVRWPGTAAAATLAAAGAAAVAGGWGVVGGGGRDVVTVIVDRRAGVDGEAVGRVAAAVQGAGVERVRLVLVPGPAAELSAGRWAAVAAAAGAADGGSGVGPVLAEEVRATAGPVVVVTGRPVGVDDRRVVVVRPRERWRGAISDVAVRAGPRPQVMVRVGGGAGVVRVRSGTVTVEQPIAAGGTTFVDLPAVGDVVRVDAVGGGTVWVARSAGAATVEVDGDVPAAVGRVAAVYGRAHPGGSGRRVRVTTAALADGEGGVRLVEGGPGGPAVSAVVPCPVTEGVRTWPRIGGGDARPPAGFRAVVNDGTAVGVAVRDGDDRQAWVDLDLRAGSRSADFVVFLADVFDWVGRADGRYGWVPPRRLGPGWRPVDVARGASGPDEPVGTVPGVYRRDDDGQLLAVNDPVDRGTDVVRLPDFGPRGRSAAGVVCLLGVVGLVVAAATWPGRTGVAGFFGSGAETPPFSPNTVQ